MPDAVGRAVYETAVDPSGLKKGLADADKAIKSTGAQMEDAFSKKGTAAVGKFGKSVDGIVGKFNAISSRGGLSSAILGGMGIGAGIGALSLVTRAISGAVDQVGQSLTLASDKAEAASKANTLFGESYAAVESASRSAASAVGMSSGKYLEAAGNIGALLQSFDLGQEASAEWSTKLVQLAADMGSFNNKPTAQAVEAIGAAFRGETEPIRAFNVVLNAAAVKAQAVSMGLSDGRGELTKSARAQATYQLILKDTVKAQGDFARTADGQANGTKTLTSAWEEMQIQLGQTLQQGLLPVLGVLVDIASQEPNTTTAVGRLTAHYRTLLQAKLDVGAATDDEADAFENLYRFFAPQDAAISDFVDGLAGVATTLGVGRKELGLYVEAALTYGRSLDEIRAEIRRMQGQVGATAVVLTEAWTGIQQVVDGVDYGAPVKATRRAFAGMFETMADAKDPWRAAWQELVRISKHPFRPANFEDWLQKKADKAMEWAANAPKKYRKEAKRNAEAFARVISAPTLAALAETEAAVLALVRAAAAINAVDARIGNFSRNGSTGRRGAHWEYFTAENGDHGVRWVEARAEGGPVSAGLPYLVGETGPEVIVPRMSGTVLPSSGLASLVGARDPGIRGWSMTPPRRSLDVRLDVTPGAAQALRGVGYDEGRVAGIVIDVLGEYVRAAEG